MSTQDLQVEAVLGAFRSLVNVNKPPKKRPVKDDHDQCCSDEIPASTNPYIRKGAKHKASRGKSSKKADPSISKKGRSPWAESYLHEAIRESPFLLYTPELYAGGLYMEAIIDKLPLPFGLICDFCYITVQTRSIKITLVEIEQAAKTVFSNRITERGKFHCETEQAVCQVREWREELKRKSAKHELLSRLRGLFDHYPLELFDEDWTPLETTKIDIGYLLIVGNSRPSHPQHHKLISDLYIKEDILFMTYPMMLDQVEADIHHKNTLSINSRKEISIEALQSPDALGRELNFVGSRLFPSRAWDDTYGIRLAGLGHLPQHKYESYRDPAFTKKLVYRSGGQCEMDGCCNPVVSGGSITGRASVIFDPRRDYKQAFGLFRLDNVALICDQHRGGANLDFKWAYDSEDPHPMTEKLKARGVFNPELDNASSDWVSSWIREIPGALAKSAEVDEVKQPDLYRQVTECALSIYSLPLAHRRMLRQISADYHGYTHLGTPRSSISARNPIVQDLLRAGLVKINSMADRSEQIEPTLFSKEMFDHCRDLFQLRFPYGLIALFSGQAKWVTKEVRKARGLPSEHLLEAQ